MNVIFLTLSFFIGTNLISSQVVINEKLLFQLSKNQTVRLASNKSFFKSYEKQKELYDDINKKLTQVVTIQDFIYDRLTRVNQTILQGKQLKYLYKYLGEVGQHSQKLLQLTAKNPQYAILLTEHYQAIVKEALLIQKELKEEILKEDKSVLMDAYDREHLISRIFDRVRILHGNVMFINLMLERARDTPYLYQVPYLRDYINADKSVVEDIMRKYQYLKY
ncbi:hypothetical protein PG593_03585 [Riemerella anatipestifer]|uniref:hypothetical protein n=1 Tax=Riemerella anatipestifer TaxID=34085 RepID=UPI000699D201|nr:hypothetical protein [Riemerella anatipestifer]MDR7693398.1 hypothetical protein [Riemerella anatipestifer]MDY3528861.1 hypothetical protein [Riemerella anatipestifer]MDY3538076.1 hypothetical protein [Riemerella anatipestifer]